MRHSLGIGPSPRDGHQRGYSAGWLLGKVEGHPESVHGGIQRDQRLATTIFRAMVQTGSVLMRYAWLLLLVAGCTPAVADVDRPGIIAELATHTACILFDLPDAPTPDVPSEGCVDGCTCNGTGREKTGDGLSTVDCRCPDGCDCKAGNLPEIPDSSASKQETPAPVAKTVADPPLVPVGPKQSVVRMSGSRWTFEGYGKQRRANLRYLMEKHPPLVDEGWHEW